MSYRLPHIYAGPYLERDSSARSDAEQLRRWRDDPLTRWVVVCQSKALVMGDADPVAALLTTPPAGACEGIFLGRFRGHPVFATEVPEEQASLPTSASRFADLRAVGGQLQADEAGLLAYARALFYWRARHRYCGTCGATTQALDGGHVMRCSDGLCGQSAFPRIDPAIIVLVEDGERALLGRQASWPEGRYSTIAGFVEPGESLEDAVAREVREETSVQVTDVRYHSSQPWPFPSSLMLGFRARALTRDVRCPDGELEDARFFTVSEIGSGAVRLPPATSISFRLIEDWYTSVTGLLSQAANTPTQH